MLELLELLEVELLDVELLETELDELLDDDEQTASVTVGAGGKPATTLHAAASGYAPGATVPER